MRPLHRSPAWLGAASTRLLGNLGQYLARAMKFVGHMSERCRPLVSVLLTHADHDHFPLISSPVWSQFLPCAVHATHPALLPNWFRRRSFPSIAHSPSMLRNKAAAVIAALAPENESDWGEYLRK